MRSSPLPMASSQTRTAIPGRSWALRPLKPAAASNHDPREPVSGGEQYDVSFHSVRQSRALPFASFVAPLSADFVPALVAESQKLHFEDDDSRRSILLSEVFKPDA